MSGQTPEQFERALSEVHRRLASEAGLVPVRLGGSEERLWVDCDLASFADNRLGDATDPRHLDRSRRARWLAKAIDQRLATPSRRTWETCYWIVRGPRRIGTIAVSRGCLGSYALVSSVYVRPPYRRQGVVAQTMQRLAALLAASGLGVRLDTFWTWQVPVQMYLRLGFWVAHWKRELAFQRPAACPPPSIEFGGDRASVGVVVDGRRIELAVARRDDRVLVHHGAVEGALDSLAHLATAAESTLSVAIALRGWPLVREDGWDDRRFSDGAVPEALARRIQWWEAWSRARGWAVDTRRIPGLPYPTLTELEAGAMRG